jgi:hypothetical protein
MSGSDKSCSVILVSCVGLKSYGGRSLLLKRGDLVQRIRRSLKAAERGNQPAPCLILIAHRACAVSASPLCSLRSSTSHYSLTSIQAGPPCPSHPPPYPAGLPCNTCMMEKSVGTIITSGSLNPPNTTVTRETTVTYGTTTISKTVKRVTVCT